MYHDPYRPLTPVDPHLDAFEALARIRPIIENHFTTMAIETIADYAAMLSQQGVSTHANVFDSPVRTAAKQLWLSQNSRRTEDSDYVVRCEITFDLVPAHISGTGLDQLLIYVDESGAGYRQALLLSTLFTEDYVNPPKLPIDRRDLMSWSLPYTDADMFDYFNFKYGQFEGVDLNIYHTRQLRLRQALMAAINTRARRVYDLADTIREAESLELARQRMLVQVTNDILGGLTDEQLRELLPAPLPGLYASVSQLPTPVDIPHWLIPAPAQLHY